jgi:TonB family protein
MLQRIVFFLVLAWSAGTAIAAMPAMPAQEHMIGVRVAVDAAGKVTSARPSDPAAIPALNQAATEIARKLAFDAATKDGVAVPSETTLFLLLALEPKDKGQFGIRLKKAQTGPDRIKSAPLMSPNYQQRDRSALVVVNIDLRLDGTVNPDSIKAETMKLKVKSSFAEARYLDAITASLRESRFVLDKVAGVDIPVRLTLPYKFGGDGGGGRRGRDEDAFDAGKNDGDASADKPAPEMKSESLVTGITLPKVRFMAPLAK